MPTYTQDTDELLLQHRNGGRTSSQAEAGKNRHSHHQK